MRKAGLLFIALTAGCFNQCDYTGYSCPSQSELEQIDGRACDPDREGQCDTSTVSCLCDSRSRRWRCEADRVDLSAPSGDLAAHDLALSGVGCSAYVACLLDCYKTQLNASVATCEATCSPKVSGDAVLRYGAARTCVETSCVSADDGGTARCVRAPDGTLLNEDGTALSPMDSGSGLKRCNLCLHDGNAGLYGDPCTQVSSADCKPAACTAAVQACLGN